MKPETFFDGDAVDTSIAQFAPLTDRVNSEPPIMKGLTATETMIAMAVFFPAWFFVGFFLAYLIGHWQVLVVLGVIGPMVSVWVGAGFLARLKRNRPDHYYRHAFSWWCHRLGLSRTPFISHRGAWSLGRSMPPIPEKSLPWWQRHKHLWGA